MQRRLLHSRAGRRFGLMAAVALIVSAVFVASAVARPIIGEITGTANTSWQNTGGGGAAQNINATVGKWTTTGYGSEPNGNDVLTVPIKVDGNGGITFNYQIQTTDVLPFDYLNIYLDTPTGTVHLVSNYNPNPTFSLLYLSPVNTITVDTRQWKGTTVTLRVVAHQDGFGDLFQALVTGLTTVSNQGA